MPGKALFEFVTAWVALRADIHPAGQACESIDTTGESKSPTLAMQTCTHDQNGSRSEAGDRAFKQYFLRVRWQELNDVE